MEVFLHHTNPIGTDEDEDGFSIRDELIHYETNPANADTDLDGLSDGTEIRILFTDPLTADTDNDTCLDLWEVENGLNPTNASDALEDPVEDRFENRIESHHGTNPWEPNSDQVGDIRWGMKCFSF